MEIQRIILWRHGQTDWNITNKFQGHSDIPLNAVGEYQVTHAATLLSATNPTKIISSDLDRAQKTAQALADLLDLDVIIDADLRETYGGNWEGKTGEENRAQDRERFVRWIDGGDEPAGEVGERRSEVAARAVAAITRALENHSGTLVVVTHGGTARCILGKILGLPQEQWGVIGILSNASWSVVERGHHRPGWLLVEHNAGTIPEPIYGEESGADA